MGGEIPWHLVMLVMYHTPKLPRFEICFVDLNEKFRGTKDALLQRNYFFYRNMVASLSIKINSPQFTHSLFWMVFRAKNRIANPESKWARRMIGTLKKAFVMTA